MESGNSDGLFYVNLFQLEIEPNDSEKTSLFTLIKRCLQSSDLESEIIEKYSF